LLTVDCRHGHSKRTVANPAGGYNSVAVSRAKSDGMANPMPMLPALAPPPSEGTIARCRDPD